MHFCAQQTNGMEDICGKVNHFQKKTLHKSIISSKDLNRTIVFFVSFLNIETSDHICCNGMKKSNRVLALCEILILLT